MAKDLTIAWLNEVVGFENPKPGLSRVNFALEHLDIKPKCKTITISGTNGKGSTTRILSGALSQQFNTAQFTSPHITNITERFVYNSMPIEESLMLEILKDVYNRVKSAGVHLSFFEVLFIGFLKWIDSLEVDYLVLEVGLGGKFDATNAIDADLSIITSIARDHQSFLGSRYDEILSEKIGISRENRPLITNFSLKYLNKLVKIHQSKIKFKWINQSSSSKENFHEINLGLVRGALELLGVKSDIDINDVSRPKEYQNKWISFYGSHNLDAVRKLVQFLSETHYNIETKENTLDLVYLSFSQRDKKEIDQMVKLYLKLVNNNKEKLILTSFDHFKSANPKMIKEIAIENGIEFVTENINVFKNDKYKNILCSGSNYFIGAIKSKYNFK
jgi:dihydrofolate synthase/folylpolyglutamate synthase